MTNRFSPRWARAALVGLAIVFMAGMKWAGLMRGSDAQASHPARFVPVVADGRRREDGAGKAGTRDVKKEGALALTAAMVAALPSPQVLLEQDAGAAAEVAVELERMELLLKERRKESIRGERIEVGKALHFPAQTDRELAALVSGMQIPASISGKQADVVRMLAMAQLAREYGVNRTVTPILKENVLIAGGGVRQSFVSYRETADRASATQWANRCQPGISALEWKFDFLVTPELLALEAEAQELCQQKVVAGGDRTEAGEAVCRELAARAKKH